MTQQGPSLPRLLEQSGRLSFGLDRRTQARVNFECPVQWRVSGANCIGWARDVSEKGAGFFVQAANAPKVGETIEVIFKLDNCFDWVIDRKAVVKWCNLGQDGMCHVGVQLTATTSARPAVGLPS